MITLTEGLTLAGLVILFLSTTAICEYLKSFMDNYNVCCVSEKAEQRLSEAYITAMILQIVTGFGSVVYTIIFILNPIYGWW